MILNQVTIRLNTAQPLPTDSHTCSHTLEAPIPMPYLFSYFPWFSLPSNTSYNLFIVCIYYLGFPCGSAGKESACNAGDLGSTPGLGRSPGEGKGYPLLQYLGLENAMDCTVHGVTRSRTRLSDLHFHISYYLPPFPEKAVAPHSSTLAWKIPWMEEPGGCSPWGR